MAFIKSLFQLNNFQNLESFTYIDLVAINFSQVNSSFYHLRLTFFFSIELPCFPFDLNACARLYLVCFTQTIDQVPVGLIYSIVVSSFAFETHSL